MDQLSDNFWNVRGDFRIAHLLNIGTHMSLVRRPSGGFVLLDSYEPGKADHDELMALTAGGTAIEAVLNLHPFHTIYCHYAQQYFPHARLIGSRRHREQRPDLPWAQELIEDSTTQHKFADILDFSMPAGVDFISSNDAVHVGSVLARHRESRIVHVDDTINVLDVPSLVKMLIRGPTLRFHPKLAASLEKRAGAADDYIRWANGLASQWSDTLIVCAAHNGIARLTDHSFTEVIAMALEAASATLDQHRQTYG
jgi:hypothetical protein